MEFNKLSETQMVAVVAEVVGEEVSYQMEDCHAFYFDGANGKTEFKVVVDQDELKLEQRANGSEDWYTTAYEDDIQDAIQQVN